MTTLPNAVKNSKNYLWLTQLFIIRHGYPTVKWGNFGHRGNFGFRYPYYFFPRASVLLYELIDTFTMLWFFLMSLKFIVVLLLWCINDLFLRWNLLPKQGVTFSGNQTKVFAVGTLQDLAESNLQNYEFWID